MGKKPITTRGREKSIWESFKRKFMAITRKTKPYSYEERLKKLAKNMEWSDKQLPPCQYSRQVEGTRCVVEKCAAFMNTFENKQ